MVEPLFHSYCCLFLFSVSELSFTSLGTGVKLAPILERASLSVYYNYSLVFLPLVFLGPKAVLLWFLNVIACCLFVYGLYQYGHLNTSCEFCFQFCFLL